MKIAPIMKEIGRSNFTARLIHTGQHFSHEMSDTFFRDLDIPEPNEHLGVGGGSPIQQTAQVMRALEESFLKQRPKLVLVVGDVTSTMAAAIVAAKMQIPLAHVEAGLRSFDRSMPEELNRIVTDALSDYLFVTEASGVRNLRSESISEERIFLVGNVMIDTLLRSRERAAHSAVLEQIGLQAGSYALVTLHRPSNVDDASQLRSLACVLERISGRLPVVFPVHPRTRQRLEEAGIPTERLLLIPPQGYLDFLRLMMDARLVLTDSGGIQEETTILQVPCLTLRENTERPVTIEMGTNRLVGTDPNRIFSAAREVLDGPPQNARVPDLWDGQASRRILEILERSLL
jgi:UDP-N-acetylglucosamine 2-epimerase (non-hydrolysing)